uniref:Putative glycerophosphocholine phosphodiesterase GPCPD1 homolog T05H10.7 n=1 Tax=Schistocephalus solidus TaxID=70667 RepID=A0A0X3PRW9_SCHSO
MSRRDLCSTVHLSVTVDTKALEKICVYLCNADTTTSSRYFVGIVGDAAEFGSWNPEKGIICKFEIQQTKGIEVWGCNVPVERFPPLLQFRYFVAEWRTCSEDEHTQKKMVVLAWESRIKPRNFELAGLLRSREDSNFAVKFGHYENGVYLQRGYLISHSELRIRLSGLALKLSKNAIPGLSSSTRDLTQLCGRRVYIACKQSLVEENGVLNALEGESPIYPGPRVLNQHLSVSSSHLIYSLEQSIAAEVRSQLTDPPEAADQPSFSDYSNLHVTSPYTRGPNAHTLSAFQLRKPTTVEFSSSPFSSRNSTCPPTPRSLSPAVSHCGEPPVFVSVLANKRCRRHLGEHTGCWGTLYSARDDVTFYVETDNAEEVGVELEIYVEVPRNNENMATSEESNLPPVKFLGSAFFGPFTENWGQKGAQLLSRRRTLMGDVRISYMVINPIKDGPPPSLQVSYKHYWRTRAALEIGHRGMGSYYVNPDEKKFEKPAQVKENTLRSFQSAVNYGADFVEMDVQLTKDFQVVVYHDFETVITPRKKRRGELQNLSVAVKDLPYSALRELRLQHASVLEKPQTYEELDDDDLDPFELQMFPLLRDCLQYVDPDVGFDIEIKYPLELKKGGSEMDNFFERNLYIDTILKEIYQFVGNRRILFSCFDADTCAMLQMKQIRYPVFQLGFDPDYADIRQQSFENLCYSAKANELLGVCVNCDDILRNPEMATFARTLGLILLVWGSAANSSENMQILKNLGVHGVIYDRMQEHKVSGTMSALKASKLLSLASKNGPLGSNCTSEVNSSQASPVVTRRNSLSPQTNEHLQPDQLLPPPPLPNTGCDSDISGPSTPSHRTHQSLAEHFAALHVAVSQLNASESTVNCLPPTTVVTDQAQV